MSQLQQLFEGRVLRAWQHWRSPYGCGPCAVSKVLCDQFDSGTGFGCEEMRRLLLAAHAVCPPGQTVGQRFADLDVKIFAPWPKREPDPHAEGKRVLGRALMGLFG